MILIFREFCNRTPFFLPMVLFSLASFFFTYVQEIATLNWLIITLFFLLFCVRESKYSYLFFMMMLFFFAWYRLGMSQKEAVKFRFPTEWHQKVIEVEGFVYSIDSLDAYQQFEKSRKISFLLEVKGQQLLGSHYMKVSVQEYAPDVVMPGDHIKVIGRFFLPRGKTIPNTFDSESYYRENKWLGQLQLRNWGSLEVLEKSYSWRKYVYLARQFIYQEFVRKLSKESAAFLSSIILGYTVDLDYETKTDFQQWGIAHIFSVSGLHLGLVGFWVWFCSGFLLTSLRKRTAITIGVTFLYCLASGMSTATVRAFIMLTCFLTGYLVKRRSSMWNNFSFAFVLMFLFDPRSVYTASFQLSFLAIAGILISQEILSRKSTNIGVNIVLESTIWQKWQKKLFESFFYPMMISAATIGITAWHFQVVSFVSVALNLIVVPAFSILMGVSFFYFMLLFILPSVLFYPLEKLIQIFMVLPSVLTGGRGLFFYVKPPDAFLILLLFVIFCGLTLLRWNLRKMSLVYLAYFFSAQTILLWQGKNVKERLVMIDVGKASACMVQNRYGENLLFDCGTVSGFDSITPYLKGEGINYVSGVFISHDDFDHFSCYPQILRNLSIDTVFHNPSINKEEKSLEIIRFETEVQKEKIKTRSVFAGDSFSVGEKDFFAKVLNPKRDFLGSKNNSSMVVLLQTAWCEVLFTGDAQDIYQKLSFQILEKKSKPRVLIFPHHGRNIKRADLLFTWFQPDLILISGDVITSDVKEALDASGGAWLITEQTGTIEISSDLKVRAYKNGLWNEVQIFSE